MPKKNVEPKGEMGKDPELGNIGTDGGSEPPENGDLMSGGAGVGPELEPSRRPRRGEQLELPLCGPFGDESHNH